MGRAGSIFSAFVIIIAGFFLFTLDITQATYDFKTQQRTDTFLATTTAVGVTTANSTLLKAIFDNDTGTIVYTSSIAEIPAVSTYNTTTRQLLTSGLTANTTRTLNVQYDISSLAGSTALNTLFTWVPFLWYMIILAFVAAAVFGIFTMRR